MSDDAIHLMRIATERKRQRIAYPKDLPFGPDATSLLGRMLVALESDARGRQTLGYGTMADVLMEEVCEALSAQPGTEAYEAELIQVAAVAVRMASASRALRNAGRG